MKKKVHSWRIHLIRKQGEYFGTVEAPDAKAAIEVAIKGFSITAAGRQQRLTARRTDG
jgi:hypothetical protein